MRALLILLFGLFVGHAGAQTHAELLAECQKLYDEKVYDQALAKANALISVNDTIPEAFKLRGDIKQRMDDFDGALDDYSASKALDNDNPRLYISRSAARITMGNFNGAIRDLERAIKLDPADSDARYNLACAKYLSQDYKGSIRDIDETLEMNPDHAEALFLRGLIRGEEFEEEAGLEDIERALTLNPDIPGGEMAAAILLFELGEYAEAANRFTEILKTVDADARSDAFYYRADCYYNLDQKDLACKDFRRAARFGDKDAPIVIQQYCETDARRIKKIPKKARRDQHIQF